MSLVYCPLSNVVKLKESSCAPRVSAFSSRFSYKPLLHGARNPRPIFRHDSHTPPLNLEVHQNLVLQGTKAEEQEEICTARLEALANETGRHPRRDSSIARAGSSSRSPTVTHVTLTCARSSIGARTHEW